jgi:hypothetical protein
MKRITIPFVSEINKILDELIVKTKTDQIMWIKSYDLPENLGSTSFINLGYQADLGYSKVYVISDDSNLSADVLIKLKQHDFYFKADCLTTDISKLLGLIEDFAKSDELTDCDEYYEFKKLFFNSETD